MDLNIGSLLKRKRKEKGLTLEEVANAVGVGTSTVSKWERGFIKNMKRNKLESLSQVLGLDPIALIRGFADETNDEEITRKQFKNEVSNLLHKCQDLSDQERMIIKSVISTIDEKK